MRTYHELNDAEKGQAVQIALNKLLGDLLRYGHGYCDLSHDTDLCTRIDAAIAQAERMQTPWFAHEYILDTCRDDLTQVALGHAVEAVYLDPDERDAVRLP